MNEFFDSALAIFCLSAIMFSAAFNVFCRFIDDSLLDRLYYWAVMFTTGAALLSIIAGKNPRHFFQTITLLIALRFTQLVYVRTRYYHRHRRNFKPQPKD